MIKTILLKIIKITSEKKQTTPKEIKLFELSNRKKKKE